MVGDSTGVLAFHTDVLFLPALLVANTYAALPAVALDTGAQRGHSCQPRLTGWLAMTVTQKKHNNLQRTQRRLKRR